MSKNIVGTSLVALVVAAVIYIYRKQSPVVPKPTQPPQGPNPTQSAQDPNPTQSAQDPNPTQSAKKPEPTSGVKDLQEVIQSLEKTEDTQPNPEANLTRQSLDFEKPNKDDPQKHLLVEKFFQDGISGKKTLNKKVVSDFDLKLDGEAILAITNKEAENLIYLLNALDEQNHPNIPYDSTKDRYEDILQIPETMVRLSEATNKAHFNGASLLWCGKHYIVMQAPLEETIGDMKAMVKYNKVSHIVCLVNNKDIQNGKCESYWTQWNSLNNKGLVRMGCAREAGQEWGSPSVVQYHFSSWPDQGVPTDIDGLIDFVKQVRTKGQESPQSAMAVHCSAGIGRTGVFMVTMLMIDLLEKGVEVINPIRLILALRTIRLGMVQAPEQLQFCFKVAERLIQEKKSTPSKK